MFVRTSRPVAALILSLLSAAALARAEGVLDHVPENALGFAAIKNIGAASAKVEKLGQLFAKVTPTPLPAPLTLVKAATGLGEGLDESGDALLVAIPGDDDAAEPRPMFVAPIADYAKFAAAVGGDAAGEICRVKIAGQEVLLAKRDGYALLMNVEDRPALEKLIAAEPKPLPHVTELADWLAANDASIVVLPTGVAKLTDAGHKGLAEAQAGFPTENADPQMAKQMDQLRDVIQMYDAALGFFGAEIEAAAIGLAIDDSTNVRLRAQLLVQDDGKLAKALEGKREPAEPLAGVANEEFVLAGGGPLPPHWSESMMGVSRHFFESYSKLYGFDKFGEDDWKEIERASAKATAGLKSISFVMRPGGEGDPIYSNFFGIARVADAHQYVASVRESMELWNKLMARSTTDLHTMQYTFSDATIADKPALLMTMDVAEAVKDPNVAMMKEIMVAMFGPDGKLRTYVVAADDHTIVMGVAGEKQMAEVVTGALKTDDGLSQSATVQTTTALLDKDSTTRMYVSPKGCVQWAERLISVFVGKLGGPVPTIPDFPDGPPVGYSFHATAEHIGGEMVWPVDTLKGLADYIETCTKQGAGG